MRSLSVIANEIKQDAGNKEFYYYAKPYVEAMAQLNTINDSYYADSADSVILYALSNLRNWRGDKAREIKAELKAILKEIN
jgi:hypothetical protein